MRLGINFPNYHLATGDDLWGAVRSRALAIERAGFDSLWIPDHFWQPPAFGELDWPMFECFATLGALAEATTRVTVGVLVASATHRPASVIAKAVTAIDVISAGRAYCGIGAGWFEEEHRAYGIEFPEARLRLDRLEETAIVLRAMFTGKLATVDGSYAKVQEALNEPAPVRRRIPILIGGGGEKRTLKIVARHADACNFGGTPVGLRAKLDVLRRYCDDITRDPDEIEITSMLTAFLTGSDRETNEVKDRLGEKTAGSLVGNAAEILEQAAGFEDAGCQHLILSVLEQGDDVIEALGEALGPLAPTTVSHGGGS